jgi:NAD(P)-dependent dehydrogenase (short-subunit alcohol dehydrogenase family)
MGASLKPLAEQVIVITGASSGHGLSTARKAAAAGARVMLAARDGAALEAACVSIRGAGGIAECVICDVGSEADVERLAAATIDRFGGFDTWVNNAGTGVYAEALDLPLPDHRKVFETNYWGTVHGSLAAVRHFKTRVGGGALINVGSINGDMGGPLLSAYNASKHAIKGFTDSLRIELIGADAPVSVTLVKPSAIGTPFPQHGRNLTGFEARLPQPLYAPELVADAILDAAQTPHRTITVGGVGKLQVLGATLLPRLFDQIASRMQPGLIDRDKPTARVEGNLYAPQGNDGVVDGKQQGKSISTYTTARLNPLASLGMLAAATAIGVALNVSRGGLLAPAKRLR